MPCLLSSLCPNDPAECYNAVMDPAAPWPPEHVCYELARASVEGFASSRSLIRGPADTEWGSGYPLPVGTGSLTEWARRRGIPARDCPPPQVTRLGAWLGLAVKRRVEHHGERGSTVWLLGLVEPDGDGWWRFAKPLVLVESEALTPAEARAVGTMHGQVLSWYRRHILGRQLPTGRPLGSGTFRDADDFKRTVGQAVRAIHSQGIHPSEARVAEYLAARPKVLRRAPTGRERPDAESVERRLRAWLEAYGYSSWQAFLDDILTD